MGVCVPSAGTLKLSTIKFLSKNEGSNMEHNYPGIPGPYWIGSAMVPMTATSLPEPKPKPVHPFEVTPREEWTLADELDSRCNSTSARNSYYGIRKGQ